MSERIINIIDEKIEQFRGNVANEEDALQLEQNFRKFLERSVEQLTSPESNCQIKDENLLAGILINLAQDYIHMPIDQKRQQLIEDTNMDKIKQASGKIYDLAIDAKKGRQSATINVDNLRQQLVELLQGVKPWNRQNAEKLVSDTILDINVIQDPTTTVLSFRLSQIFRGEIGVVK